ncbi:hypothetical protein V6N11_026571 [Hibiscus sabdariffa]|uniref:Uncharacterized protein n=1 Tax=Hibiscus sabdariffa TaxID=183260 RepID=A0ABR2SWZ7_9ROSI
MEVQYINSSYPYNSTGSFMEYFEGLTYQHADFIFDGPSHVQESVFPSTSTNFYKFGLCDSGNISYCDHGHSYEVNNQELCADEYRRAPESSSSMSNEQTEAVNMELEGNASTTSRENPVDYVVFLPVGVDGLIRQLLRVIAAIFYTCLSLLLLGSNYQNANTTTRATSPLTSSLRCPQHWEAVTSTRFPCHSIGQSFYSKGNS